LTRTRRTKVGQEGGFTLWLRTDRRLSRKRKKVIKKMDADAVMTMLIEEVWRRRG